MSRSMSRATASHTALFIGEGDLLVSCVECYQQLGGTPVGVLSSDVSTREWAEKMGIPHQNSSQLSQFLPWLDNLSCDFLFSAANVDPIPSQLLAAAKRDCFSFYEGPAIHSRTAKRILSKEDLFPIQWHRISFDQAKPEPLIVNHVNISDEETTTSLNDKIIESAVDGFSKMVKLVQGEENSDPVRPSADDISIDENLVSQSLSLRPYVWLDWSEPAAEIHKCVRASISDEIANYNGLVKFEDRGQLYILKNCKLSEPDPTKNLGGMPGEILGISSESMKVATGKGILEILNICDLDGNTIDFSSIFKTGYIFGNNASEQFGNLQYHIAEKWVQDARTLEPEVVRDLMSMHPFEMPSHWKNGSGNELIASKEALNFSELLAFPIWSPTFNNQFESGAWLAGLLADFIHRLTGQSEVTIPVSARSFFPTEQAWQELVCPFLPVHWNGRSDQPVQDGWWQHRESILKSTQLGVFLRDIFLRSPELSGGESKGILSQLLNCYVGALADIESLSTQPVIGIEQLPSGYFRFFADEVELSPNTASALTKAFHSFFQSISENPGLEIPFLNIGNPGAVKRLDTEFTFDIPASASVIDFIESQSKRNPNQPAVKFGDSQITYSELWDHSGHFAAQIQKVKDCVNRCIGIYTDKSIEYIVSFIAILRAGGCLVPLRRSLPSERLSSMVQMTGIELVLAKKGDLDKGADWCNGMDLIEVSIHSGRHFSMPDEIAIDYASQAYVIFTSGSTGTPKPVQVGHRELLHHMLSFSKALSIESNDVVLQFAGLSFDVSIEEIIPTLCMGATLVVNNENTSSDLNLFWKSISRHQISILNLPTAFWYSLIDESNPEDVPLCINHIIVGGEKVSSSYLERWFKFCPHPITLWNGYGPTETTITATLNPITKFGSHFSEEPVVPLGFGLGCCDIFVCDAFGKPLPIGIPGEILITGQGVSRGYLNQSDLTRKSFIESPMIGASVEHGRAYKSGDFGFISKDRSLHFFGRADSQVKIRGFRLELSEVEKLIENHIDVEKAIVIDIETAHSSSKALAAFIKWRRGSALSLTDLRKDLQGSMAGYMIPTYFEPISIWPRTPNGKIDHGALSRMIESANPKTKNGEIAPITKFTPNQFELLQIWEDILGSRPSSLEENFFHSGGDSLNAMRFLARVGKDFSTNITLTEFYEQPDILSLSTSLEQKGQAVKLQGTQNGRFKLSVPLSQSDSSHPVFILPGGAGGDIEVFIYKSLADSLGKDLKVYTFQPLKSGMDSFPYESVQAITEDIFNEIREIQPTGPYFLVGDCIGSILLFEIVSRLEKLNEEVKSLSLLDTQPGYHKDALDSQFARRFQAFVVNNPWFGRLTRVTGYLLGLVKRAPWNWQNYINDLRVERKRQMELIAQAQKSSQLPESSLPEALGTTYFEMLCKSTPKKIKSPIHDYLPTTKKELELSKTWKSVTSGNYFQSFYSEPPATEFQGRIFDYLRERKKGAMPTLRKQLIDDGVFDVKN